MSFYTKEELAELGFKKLGKNVLISKKASIYDANNMVIGSNVRIDDFCILSGIIEIGNYVHIAAYSALFAGDVGIELQDFTGLSSKCVVYAISDDYSGEALTNPMIPDEYRKIIRGKVILKKHALVGTNTTILPGVTLGEGSSIGACSLVTRDCDEWWMYIGISAKKLKQRSKKILELEEKMKKEQANETIS